jgi:hypothetical protein
MSEQLFDAISKGNISAARKALDAGADPNKNDKDYGKPLVRVGLALWNSRGGMPRKDTPLTTKQREIGELLIARGAKLDFESAVMLNKPDFVAAALAKDPKLAKAKLKVNDHDLKTMAAWCGATDTYQLLKTGKIATPTTVSPEPLVKAIDKSLAAFAKKHKGVKITKLVLDVNADEGDVFLAIDTTDSDKWNPGDFTHSQFGELHDVIEARGNALLDMCVQAILAIGAKTKLPVLAIDHDETEDAARKRMKSAAKKR